MGSPQDSAHSYRPQANGVVERNNRTLGDALRTSLLDGDQRDWDQVLPHTMRALRALLYSTTKKIASYLMLGRELRLQDELYRHVPLCQSNSHLTMS